MSRNKVYEKLREEYFKQINQNIRTKKQERKSLGIFGKGMNKNQSGWYLISRGRE